jgi:hypothetical protein
MKQNGKSKLPARVRASAPCGEPASRQSGGNDDILEEHRDLMTRGEQIFYLRDVHPYWSTPRISPREMEELEIQRLIERSPGPICSIRLTKQGAAMKNGKPIKVP